MIGKEQDPAAPSTPDAAKAGRGWSFYLVLTAVALALIFVLQNTEDTNVTFLFADTELPLFFALVISIVLGAVIGWLAPRLRRSKDD